ncbi:golgin candidate 2 [Phtheirospermum japonicum]|uniref:Golgin candidate 2 n=1 Tax=Phtheirospermum japonicum TaxID=374723 RepID=A0A830BG50_9LAMI|nr:golgin candidate 2 [Phtheirospermum japonicum]
MVQIDQQAAESLGKNEKPLSDDQSGVDSSPRNSATKPLIKDQLRKKSPENPVNQSIINTDKQNLKVISRSNSVVNRDDETVVSPNPNPKPDIKNSDWTELLSVPDKRGVSGIRALKNPGIRALKKDVKKATNPLVVDGGKKVRNNGVSENSNSGDSDATPRSSNVQSPSSGGECDQMNGGSTLSIISKPDLADMERVEGVNDTVNVKELDMKVGMKDGERLKRDLSASNRFVKKVSKAPSDRESNSETDSSGSSDSESEREREERRKRRQHILAERAAAKAVEAIKERENLVARLEGEKQSLEKILEERAKQQVQEASELQTTMMETMEAVEVEKQKHNNTRMEALTRLAKLEKANADLTRSLANVQKSLEVEVDRVAELRQQIHIKEATHEELRRKISSTHHDDAKLRAPKGVEFELEMLEAEYSFVNDKVRRMQDQAKTLETSIETTRREIENPTEIEIELKRRLRQLTDHLIQKQAQVETLSSEKAMLLLRIEAASRMLDEYKPMIDSAEFPGTSSRDNLETVSDKSQSGAVFSLENMNNTGSV